MAAATPLQCRCLLALPTICRVSPVLDVNQINCLPPTGILPAIVPRQAKEFGGFSATCHAPRAPISDLEETQMADNNDDDIPFMQRLLDNHFLLLFLGVVSPGLLYILWGIIDIMNTPVAR
jgi:hypothetical protein